MEESGASLIRFRRQPFDAKTKVAPLQLQVLEPDFIDVTKNIRTQTGYIDRGIEYDMHGRRVAYWLHPHHPGEFAGFRFQVYQSERVPVEELVYLYNKLRPGQDRGMPLLAPEQMTRRPSSGR